MKKVLEVKNITKIYKVYKSNIDRLKEIFMKKKYHKEFISNNNITFDLFEGETLGIIGVNGAGKSTLLKQIVGVTIPTSGKIIKHGNVAALLELGTGFNNEITGYDNIYLNGTLIGMTKAEINSKLENIISFSELGDYIYEPLKTYSSGMRMRLAFSIAIFSEPKILIVDEALSVGDAHFSAKCTTALKQKKKKNMSIVYVSHDLNSLKMLCDRVMLLNNGKVVNIATPDVIINEYHFLIAKLNDTNQIMKINQDDSSFGTFEITIKKIVIKQNGREVDSIMSGEYVDIELHINSKINIEDLTIGIHIKDKFSQNIFGTNTFYQNVKIIMKENTDYICKFSMDLNIGEGKYTIGAALHTGDWHSDTCYHWLENGMNFTVLYNTTSLSIGLCRLYPEITLMPSK